VLRPGGRIALLEVGEPESRLLRLGHRVWFTYFVPRLGALLSDGAAYRYLPRSIAYLPSFPDFVRLLGEAGFTEVRREALTGCIAQCVTATRAQDESAS
jgi:demethylmenaquinone methyltransferase/2-methoxy-6-polyprenyl-1,4-benzoquinol methylase